MSYASQRWQEFRAALTQAADYQHLYQTYGCTPVGSPNAQGFVSCHSHPAFGGDDRTPSAAFNVNSGVYTDFRAGKTMSFWDFMVAIGVATDWRDAQEIIARQCNIKPPSNSKNSPLHGVSWTAWSDDTAIAYCQKKTGITLDGLRTSDARMAIYMGELCFCWPVYTASMVIVGFHFLPVSGEPFSGSGAKAITKRYPKENGGFVGTPAVGMIAGQAGKDESPCPRIYWLEGMTDVLAAYSKYPNSNVFLANTNGCAEAVRETHTALLKELPSQTTIVIIPDADCPGIDGAKARATSLHQALPGRKIEVRALPYDVRENHGQDLRDFLAEKKVPAGPADLADHLAILEVELSDDEVVPSGLESVGVSILSSSPSGSFLLDCAHTGRRRRFRSFWEMQYTEMVALAGNKFKSAVARPGTRREMQLGKMSFDDFREALAVLISSVSNTSVQEIGDGIWGVAPKLGESPDYYLLSGGVFHRIDKKVEAIEDRLVGDRIACLDGCRNWVDIGRLNHNMTKAQDPTWRRRAHMLLMQYLSSWPWDNPQMALIVAGLVYATWIQSIFPWRPIVTVTGESNSGKTYLLKMLSEIFLETARPVAGSVAGVLQPLGVHSRPILLDEFDSVADQAKLLQVFRLSSRGQEVLKGTADQKGKSYSLRHIPWISGIFTGSDRQADRNRMITLSLKSSSSYTIDRPSTREAIDLGYGILGSVLAVIGEAESMVHQLQEHNIKRKSPTRFHESYNVPFAAMAAVNGLGLQESAALLDGYFSDYLMDDVDNKAVLSDQASALQSIMLAVHEFKAGCAPEPHDTVLNILTQPKYEHQRHHLESFGIGRKDMRTGPRMLVLHVPQLVKPGGLLKGTPWVNNPGLSQVLGRLAPRIPIVRRAFHMGGACVHCVALDFDRCISELKKNLPPDNGNGSH